ncbi:hypothetical protein [Bradyrhizobium sp. 195]|uniref:hypothetical protein n=1 Tax=Bradyrhizobium sp. 195 TaxID=2782662 RepID=UPI002000A38C|nr:hypothetical protein [Bradyrhizobium sp. 195]UPK24327.1 hypothetical protein IVB26_23515 [Bradyrhizobium sp. 195]
MDALTLFGLFAVTAMLVCYAMEDRSHWFVLLFAASCALGSAYGFLQGAWPFGLVEAIWSVVALRRWHLQAAVRKGAGEGTCGPRP